MNNIQRCGVICGIVFFMPSLFCDGRLGVAFGLLAWTSFLMGYVAGGLWKVRHALHYWWSIAFAATVHVFLLPLYASLTRSMKTAPNGADGKGYMYLGFGLMIAETLALLFILKHAAMWLHLRTHANLQTELR
jgi:hypothetical protein